MKKLNVTIEQVQNYLINRSFLNTKANNLLDVIEYFKCIQVDPISVVAKSHELALFNRVANFRKSDLESALYEKHQLFEYWLQLFSIIPIKYFPYMTARMHIIGDWQDDYYKKHPKEIDETLDFIKANGVTSSKDLSHLKITPLFSWSGNNSATAALAYLWDRGEIMIHHRDRNNRYYDLKKRILPQEFNSKVTSEESIHFLVSSIFSYLGIARTSYISKFGYVKTLPIRQKLNEMIAAEEIIELTISDVKTKYYILESQLSEFKKLSVFQQHDQLNILPPLDPLVIDRRILLEIFGFEYTWEAYVPAAKRKFGYYGMPLLYKGKFVGQVELQKILKHKLKVKNLQTAVKTSEFKLALTKAVKEMEKFVFNSPNLL